MAKNDVRKEVDNPRLDKLYKPVDPKEYCLFDNVVFSRAGELKPHLFLSDLVSPFIGRTRLDGAKGQVHFNNGSKAYSPILDILSWSEDIYLGVEMQGRGSFPPSRALAYLSNIVVPNIPKGVHLSSPGNEVEGLPKRWVLLIFCDFHPFPRDERAVHRFSFKGDGTNRAFGDGVSYVYVDCKSTHLNKRQRLAIHDLKAKKVEDMTIQSFKDALCYAQRESNVIEKRRKEIAMTFEEYETMIYNQAKADIYNQAKAEGIAIGKAETAAETKAQERADFAGSMVECGYPLSEVARILKVSEDEVRSLLEKPA